MTVSLPLSTEVDGQTWSLYTFEYNTPDGRFCGYLHAASDEHASMMLDDMRRNAELVGRMAWAER